jgi:hypothetical protein
VAHFGCCVQSLQSVPLAACPSSRGTWLTGAEIIAGSPRLLNAVNKHGGPLYMELANELRMSKVMQLCAAIAPRGFVLPKHLNLMSSDACNRARSAGLIIVFTDPDDAVTQR